MATEDVALGGLPDELLLEILLCLSTIRSYETQSWAFQNKQKESARQRENHTRQLALFNLCLTSQHLRRIATPILYASFTGSATWHGIEPLRLFHRTISRREEATSSFGNYAKCLQYVENRLSDYLGRNLYADTDLPDAAQMVARYFYLLADIVKCAPNLQHLCVASLETNAISLWNYILPRPNEAAASARTVIAEHGLSKLQTLCVQLHTKGYGLGAEAASFRRICSSMTAVPSLADFRASGVMTTEFPGPDLGAGAFKTLQRLELIECVLDIDEVVDMWSACEGLRHIVCVWSYLSVEDEATPSDLYPGLLLHAQTLETLHVDLREIRWDYEDTTSDLLLGTLRPFEHLETLVMSRTGILAHCRIMAGSGKSNLLPVGLKSLTVLLNEQEGYPGWLDQSMGMINLYNDCKTSVPSLRDVIVKFPSSPSPAPCLTADFAEIGVRLSLNVDF
jgi:hypothetical protein